MLNLHDQKTKNYKILVALATGVLNREYVMAYCMYCIIRPVLSGFSYICFE